MKGYNVNHRKPGIECNKTASSTAQMCYREYGVKV